jgi:hypothetical protein
VKAFDEDGVELDAALPSGRTRVTWDEIERGRVALDQARFNDLLGELGLPLYRTRQRLKLGDVRGAGEAAETLYARFRDRRSQSAYLVCQAVMWSRIDAGRCESAVEPALRCFELLKTRAATLADLPGMRRPQFDVETGLASELAPVWFDPAAARSALADVERAMRGMSHPRPAGAYVYYATLAITAGETSEGERVLPLLSGMPGGALVDLVAALREQASGSAGPATERLRFSRVHLPEECRTAAIFVVGLADSQSEQEDRCKDGLLELLSIPAGHGQEQRGLAAAALYYAVAGLDKLKDAPGAAAVRSELMTRFAGTRFAEQLHGKMN